MIYFLTSGKEEVRGKKRKITD